MIFAIVIIMINGGLAQEVRYGFTETPERCEYAGETIASRLNHELPPIEFRYRCDRLK